MSAVSFTDRTLALFSSTIRALLERAIEPERLQANAVRFATVLLIAWATFAMPGFASPGNVSAIMYATAAIGIASVGMA